MLLGDKWNYSVDVPVGLVFVADTPNFSVLVVYMVLIRIVMPYVNQFKLYHCGFKSMSEFSGFRRLFSYDFIPILL